MKHLFSDYKYFRNRESSCVFAGNSGDFVCILCVMRA